VVFTRARVAVFLNSCFWHACPEHGRRPTRNEWYWAPKLARTVDRDRQAVAVLEDAGWQVIRIWEHENLAAAAVDVTAAVHERRADEAT
jgi:DNA mismatch endonuclease (patch repair protein)